MLTFQEAYQEIQSLTGDNSTAGTASHKLRYNQGYKKILTKFNRPVSGTISTTASTQEYKIPYNINKISSVKITISNIDYPMAQIMNEDNWNLANDQGTSFTSRIPTNYYIRNNSILFYPTPSSSSDTITIYGTLSDKDLSQDNYTTGTITTLANGGTAVTGNGTSWTTAMIGRYLKINNDGWWYKISNVSGATSLTIEKLYGGTSIVAGTESYVIAEIPQIQEDYQYAPIYYACWNYFLSKRDTAQVATYKALWDGIYRFIRPDADTSTSVIADIGMASIKNPNDYWRV